MKGEVAAPKVRIVVVRKPAYWFLFESCGCTAFGSIAEKLVYRRYGGHRR